MLKESSQKVVAISAYALALIFLFYEMIMQVSPGVIARGLMRDLHINAVQLGIISGIYYYSYSIMQIPIGMVFDGWGVRKTLTCAGIICGTGGIFFSLTQTICLASIGRFLMGMGSAAAFIGVLVVATHWFHPKHFAFLVGIAQVLGVLGAIGGELPLALLVNHYHWRDVICVLGIIGMLLAVVICILIRDHPQHKIAGRTEDPLKVLLSGLAEVIKGIQSWILALYAFCLWGPVVVFAILWGIPYLTLRYAISEAYASSACSTIFLGVMIGSPFIGWLSDKIGQRRILMKISSLMGLSCSLIILYLPNIPLTLLFIFLFLFGVAASSQLLTFALVKENNRPIVNATAIGFNNMAVVLGGAIFHPLVGYILQLNWRGDMADGVPVYSLHNYNIALSVIPLCFLIGALASFFFINETYCKPRYSPDPEHEIL